ncbi:hypothetical protein CBL_08061 [Carabus blaptoides fortunei]
MLKKVRPNVCSAVKPLHIVSKGLGVQPYSMNVVDGFKTPLSTKKDAIYTVIFVIIYLALTVYTAQNMQIEEASFTLISKYSVVIEVAMLIILMFTFIFFGFLFRKYIIKILKRLCAIDLNLEMAKIDMDYKKMEKWIYSVIIYIIVSGVFRLFMMINTMNIDILIQLLLCAATFVKSVAKNQFVILVVQVRDRYERINETVKSMFLFKSSVVQVSANSAIKKITESLYILCRVHYKLRKVIQNIITAYSIQLLGYLGVALANIIFQSYLLYALITSHKDHMTIYFMGSSISWLIDEIYELYTLVKTCSTTCNIAAETATILHQLRNHIKNMELESHIIGAVTTYLVILIQFDQAQISISNSRLQMANNSANS